MNNKILILSYPRTGSTFFTTLYNEYMSAAEPETYIKLPDELLNIHHWQLDLDEPFLYEFFEKYNTSPEQLSSRDEIRRVLFSILDNADNFCLKYFPWMDEVVQLDEIIERCPELNIVVLYRENVFETIASHAISIENKVYNLRKDDRTNIVHSCSSVTPLDYDEMFYNIRKWQDLYVSLRERHIPIFSTVSYEDMSFTQSDLYFLMNDYVYINTVSNGTLRKMSRISDKRKALKYEDTLNKIIMPNLHKHVIYVDEDLKINIVNEYNTFKSVFVEPLLLENNKDALRAKEYDHLIGNPTFSCWEKFSNQYRICVSSIRATALDTPETFNGMLSSLAEKHGDSDYNNHYYRAMSIFNIAVDMFPADRSYSLPIIKLYNGRYEVCSGNKLIAAHQLLDRDVLCVILSERDKYAFSENLSDFDRGLIYEDNIRSISALSKYFIGNLSLQFQIDNMRYAEDDPEKLYYQMIGQSSPLEWQDENGNICYPNFNHVSSLYAAELFSNGKTITIYSPNIEDYFDTFELESLEQLERLIEKVNQEYDGNNSVSSICGLSSAIIPDQVNMYKIIVDLKRTVNSLQHELDNMRDKI